MNINTKIDNILFVAGAIKLDVAKLKEEKRSLLRRGRSGFTSVLIKIVARLEKEIVEQRIRALDLTQEAVDLYTFQINKLKENA